ncbi:MAG: efflux RND transporter permease subunit, partial [Pseudomonadota bacterium]
MRRFNLSEWALANRQLVLFAMLAFALIGAWSYKHLGQSEDPPFTFKAMVVRTLWPGATAEQVSRQVTEPIEKALMNTGEYEFIRSYSRPGESQVIFMARDSLRSRQIPDLWYQVRKRVGDIRATLPREIVGPFFNDEFGDTYGNIYALTGKGFDYAVMRDYADRIQLELQRVPDVGKIDLVGLQDEKVWIELSNTRLATLGVSMQQVQQALADQNAVTGTSFFETATDRVQLRVTGQFNDIEAIRQFPIRAGDRTVHLGDIAEVKRGFADPASPKMRFMGEEAIGLAVAMKDGGDILKLGANLDAEFQRLQKTLPAGMQLRKVSDQPQSVEESVGEFVQVLTEAVVIVLLVSFFSLGLRTGLVVGVTIPLVLAMTFFVMHYFDIGLHKISLGALVLALGLLVDDAIIAVEMMATKMEQGYDRLRAASFAWESTAFPMLTGTLITAAGFLPIATAASSTGEYTRSLFQVVTIALVVSWIAAVLFIPYLGDKMLPDLFNPQPPKPGSLSARWHAKRQQWADRYPALANLIAPPQHGHDHDPYQRPFYRSFRRFLDTCLRHRWWVIAATIALFVFSLMMFRFVPQQFFPDSTRPELMVDIELAEGASLRSTQAQAEKLEKLLSRREGIANYVSYVGTGSPRFYLPLDQQLPATNFAQFVVLAKDIKARESTRDWLLHEVIPKFPDVQMRVTRLENGPPVGYPVQMRISGEHIEKVQAIARQVEAKVRENPHVMNVNLDWSEPSKVVRLVVDQERARALGVSSAQVSQFLSSSLAGQSVSVYREGNRQIEMLLRGPADERNQLELLSSLSMPTANGGSITLSQVATMEYGFEDGIIWHRNRLPTVTVR